MVYECNDTSRTLRCNPLDKYDIGGLERIGQCKAIPEDPDRNCAEATRDLAKTGK